jgi:His/Glu/Gln/Arg/opine family amino acid ABC transporter permease subunit
LEFLSNIGDKIIQTFVTQNRYKLFLEGFGNTILIAVCATILGVLIGTVVALCRVQHMQTGKLKILDRILSIYVAIIRGTPVVLQVMIMYYIVLASLKEYAVMIAILAFGLNSGAYVSEIIRGGIMAVDSGQMEAGRSLGLSRVSTMLHVILPQAVKNCLPSLGNEFISVLKETSVVGYIPVTDLTRASDRVIGITYNAFFPLISVAVVYFILVAGLSALFKKMERKLAVSDRG